LVSNESGHVFPRDFTQDLPMAVKASGIYIYDDQGKEYIDGCSGALISNVGHCVPEVVEAVCEQLRRLEFAHTSRWRNEAIELAAAQVASLAPMGMSYVWFVSGGSEAVESAVRLARSFYLERDGGGSQKHLVIGRWNSYHGSTMGAVAVGGNIPRRRALVPMFMEHPKIETHYCYRCPFSLAYPSCGCLCARKLEEAIKRIGPQYVAAFLAEPIVGSTVGALPPPDEYWSMVREICDRYDVLLIADEVMTGFGRTGKSFAVDHWGVTPDIIACAKGMAAGYVPTGGVIVKDAVAEVIKKGSGAFPMAHTYCGNPVSGAAVEAVIKYIKAHNLVENARLQGELLGSLLKELEEIPIVGEVRGKGLMWGIELVADKATKRPFPRKLKASGVVTRECMRRGLVVYPGGGMADGVDGDNFMVAPPLIVEEDEVREIASRLKGALEAASEALRVGV